MLESFPAWICVFLCRGCKWRRDVLFFLAPSMRNVLDVTPSSLPCMVSSLRGGNKTILSKTPVLLQGMWETLVFNTIEYLFWFPFCFFLFFRVQNLVNTTHVYWLVCYRLYMISLAQTFYVAVIIISSPFFAALRRKIRDRLLIYHSCIWKLLLLFCLFSSTRIIFCQLKLTTWITLFCDVFGFLVN